MRDYFYFDFETRSQEDLKTVGRVNYFNHPSTEPTLLTWAINDGPIEQWAIGDEIPESLISLLEHEEPYYKVAHNIAFDLSAMKVFAKKYNISLAKHWFDTNTYIDTMAIGEYYRVGASLDRISTVMGWDNKTIHGKAIMKKQGSPDRKGHYPVQLTDEEFKHFKEYGQHDVEMCRKIHQYFPPLPFHEQQLWQWTYENNQRGIFVDFGLLTLMKWVLRDDVKKLLPEFAEITGGKYKIGSPKLKEYFAKEYEYCTNMRSHTVDKMLKDPKEVDPKVKRALQIKKILGSTSTKKVAKGLDLVAEGFRIHDVLTYHKAITKRWSGKDESGPGIQIQNFPRSEYKKGDINPRDKEYFNQAMSAYQLDLLDSAWVKNNLRRIWEADDGQVIHCADYSRIEPVVLFWLSGMGKIPDNWYEQMASTVFNIPAEDVKKDSYERHIGKFASLSCGYGISTNGFVKKSEEAGVAVDESLASRCVYGYRRRHPQVPLLWETFMRAFEVCFHTGREQKLCDDLVKFKRIKSISPGLYDMEITLPSGGKIFYRKVKYEPKVKKELFHPLEKHNHKAEDFIPNITYLTAHKGRVKLWYGALTEHICSGTARELMGSALLRLEREGYRVICTVHDELWVQAEPGDAIQAKIKELMEIKPMWARGLKELKVEIESGKRYLK